MNDYSGKSGFNSSVDHTQEIRAAQVKLLYEQTPAVLTATLANGAILVLVLWRTVPASLLSVWLLLILLTAFGRHGIYRAYRRNNPGISGWDRWRNYYAYAVVANGVLWGLSGFFFFTPNSPTHQVFLAFVLAGMLSGGMSTLSPVRGVYPLFLIPAMIPYGVRLVFIGGPVHLAMSGMLFVYVAMMWIISHRLYCTVAESLRLRFDNIDLLENLMEARERQEVANQELAAQIAEKRSAEEALQKAYGELEHRVQERTEELAQSEEALRDADQRKNEFIAMLGHELRNPLAPIRNAVMLMHNPEVPESVLTWGRGVIDRQVAHLARLVDDLLDVSRIVQGKISLQESLIEISTVINQAVEASRPHIDLHHHDLVVTGPREPVWVRGDFVRLAQVISNLLNNAAKYTDNGGSIRLTVEVSHDWVMVRVRDNGIGIAPKVLPHVFDLFTQADQSLARTQSGLGIGLTLVKRLIDMHGGRVEARSEPGSGSEFVVHLPRQSAPVAASSRTVPLASAGTSGGPLRVLVIDDNQDAAETIAVILGLEGHDVDVAFDSASALAKAGSFHPHAVLLDIGMPVMDGYEIVHELRTMQATKSAVILAVTGYGQPEDRARTKAAGFNGHLTKPVDPKLLVTMLKSHFS